MASAVHRDLLAMQVIGSKRPFGRALPLVLGLTGACASQTTSPVPPAPDAQPVICPPNGGDCLPASDVHKVHVLWTVSGQPASDASCGAAGQLALQPGTPYDLDGGWGPIPCNEGEFTIVDLPIWTTFAVLYRVGDDPYSGSAGTFDGTGDLVLDLPY